MSIALDVGAHQIRSLRRRDPWAIGRRCRSSFAVLPNSPSQRRVLEKTRLPFATCEDALVLMGDTAAEFAHSFRTPSLPLLPDSRVPRNDAPARQVLAAILESLLPQPIEPGEVCCFAMPGLEGGPHDDGEFVDRILRLRGFEPLATSRGAAAVLAFLVEKSFTGIGIDFGAGTTALSVVHRGVEVARHVTRRGGNWIDQRLAREFDKHAFDVAGHRYLDTEAARLWKEKQVSILELGDERGEFLGEVYTELLATVLERSANELSRTSLTGLPTPLDVVCTGGTASIEGFSDLLRELWARADYPLPIGEVRTIVDSDFTIARGCLINAELETSTRRRRTAA